MERWWSFWPEYEFNSHDSTELCVVHYINYPKIHNQIYEFNIPLGNHLDSCQIVISEGKPQPIREKAQEPASDAYCELDFTTRYLDYSTDIMVRLYNFMRLWAESYTTKRRA